MQAHTPCACLLSLLPNTRPPGMYPIQGRRYQCKDCPEAIGFDLCGACQDRGASAVVGRCGEAGVAQCTRRVMLTLRLLVVALCVVCKERVRTPKMLTRCRTLPAGGSLLHLLAAWLDRCRPSLADPSPHCPSTCRFNQQHTAGHRMELIRPRITAMHLLQVRGVCAAPWGAALHNTPNSQPAVGIGRGLVWQA